MADDEKTPETPPAVSCATAAANSLPVCVAPMTKRVSLCTASSGTRLRDASVPQSHASSVDSRRLRQHAVVEQMRGASDDVIGLLAH